MARVTFRATKGEAEVSVEVEPGTTILEAAEQVHARVGSSCGGQCACSTCHVYIASGEGALSDMEDDESDRLDMAFDVRPESRLACQTKIVEDEDVVVELTEEGIEAFYNEHPGERAKRHQAAG